MSELRTGADGGGDGALPPDPDRNLALELVRVTEAAAIAAARFMGRGDKEQVDQAAVDAMRPVLRSVAMDGIVVIGEGDRKSTRLNSSHPSISYAVFCLKKKKKKEHTMHE